MKPLPVLIVEDDASLREALTDTLELSGYEVLQAADGKAALALLENRRVGLVVSDVQMQPMDGEQLLREIKRRSPGLPVLLMTAYGMIERAVEAMRAGACNYLPKPFEPEALVAEVARWMLPAAAATEDDVIDLRWQLVLQGLFAQDIPLLPTDLLETDDGPAVAALLGAGRGAGVRSLPVEELQTLEPR